MSKLNYTGRVYIATKCSSPYNGVPIGIPLREFSQGTALFVTPSGDSNDKLFSPGGSSGDWYNHCGVIEVLFNKYYEQIHR